MKNIRTIALLGAGAVGCYFLRGLTGKYGDRLCLVAEGERACRLKDAGLLINGIAYHPQIKTPEEAKGADLLIVALKYNALRPALNMIGTIAGPDTIVLCPMNGVECEEIIAGRIGAEHLVWSIIRIASQRVGNSVLFDPDVTLGVTYGEKDGRVSEKTGAIEDAFAGTGVQVTFSDHIMTDMWEKYALNISMNLPQAIIGCGIGAYTDSEHVLDLYSGLRQEVEDVAAAKGYPISHLTTPPGLGNPSARYSTLQDLDAGRHTEVDMFSGAMVRMGRELGIPTPYNAFAYHAIKALEEKNDGMFDY